MAWVGGLILSDLGLEVDLLLLLLCLFSAAPCSRECGEDAEERERDCEEEATSKPPGVSFTIRVKQETRRANGGFMCNTKGYSVLHGSAQD